jgi:hypothetical protein
MCAVPEFERSSKDSSAGSNVLPKSPAMRAGVST